MTLTIQRPVPPLLAITLVVISLSVGVAGAGLTGARETTGEYNILQQREAACTLRCLNGGTCQFGVSDFGMTLQLRDEDMLHGDPSYGPDSHHTVSLHTNAHDGMYCQCPAYYAGAACEIKLNKCGTNGQCSNGAECDEDEDDVGNSFKHCECVATESDLSGPYAMHFCHNIAMIHCVPTPQDEQEGAHYKHSYCYNGGECRHILGHPRDQHQACACISGWEGPHCEYVVGTAPKAIMMDDTSNETIPAGVVAVIILIALMAGAVVGVVSWKVYNKLKGESKGPSLKSEISGKKRAEPSLDGTTPMNDLEIT